MAGRVHPEIDKRSDYLKRNFIPTTNYDLGQFSNSSQAAGLRSFWRCGNWFGSMTGRTRKNRKTLAPTKKPRVSMPNV